MQLPWFGLECPTKYHQLHDPAELRRVYISEKILDQNPDRKIKKRVLINR